MKLIKFTYACFLIYLLDVMYGPFNAAYIQLKQSIGASAIPYAILYGVELIALVIVMVCIFKLVRNVDKKIIFERANLRMLQCISIALCTSVVVQFIGRVCGWIDQSIVVGNFKMWMAGAMFVLIIAEIFKKGIELKEEQEMVI